MRIGFNLPQFGSHSHRPEGIARFAREAEKLGADSLWVGDRLLAPVHPEINYPGEDGIPDEFRAGLDPFATLTIAAAVTSRPLLGTSVLIAPWYAPALLARSLTTVDRFSGGRLIAGLGAGWMPEEFQSVGVPYGERGARLDECLDALEAYWTTNPVAHKGRFTATPASYVDVKPVRRRIPIYLPSFTPAGIKRAARRADGIIPAAFPGHFDPAVYTGMLAQVRAGTAQAGRRPEDVDFILRINTKAGDSVDSIADVLLRSRDAAIDHAFVDLTFRDRARDVEHAIDLAGRILDRVR
ncbi:TIGR03619 family F420-dependent LLM class oxidoreductase [Kutzneria sp. CA-103260]|uniref:TIGR03619 family F420-dependent LLM class oxidoreductase n=1 Tax=Kutzneria sp. CA-103260 TaxID=2802641 RepID=UPI001BAC810D|nr:TIGR03619 family F420-dependent LLM class oxidoreductase [Kutzneria sp. CA-103260]QUQ62856.1 hydride transferase 1 [Kutzneria sp. CA-103260]